jgi:diguanylate cyclase (GGDEF)-like protein
LFRCLSLPGQTLPFVALILAVGGLSSWQLQHHLSDQLMQQALLAQKHQVEADVAQFDATLAEAEQSIEQFAELVSSIDPTGSQVVEAATAFNQLVQRDRDGAWRSRADRFRPDHQAGIWLPPTTELSRRNSAFFALAQPITGLFGLGVSSLMLENTWVLPLSGGIVIFWPSKPEFIRQAAADLDYRPTPWVQLTAPALNPRGRPRWTQPDYDPAARDWLISVVAPFHQGGRWAGAVGHDLLLRDLLRWLIPLDQPARGDLQAEPLYVVAGDGRLLVQGLSGRRSQTRLPARHQRVLQPVPAAQRVFSIDLGDDHLIVARLPRLAARAVYRVDAKGIQGVVRRELSVVQLGVTLFMALLSGVALLLLSREASFRRREQSLLEERNRHLEQQMAIRTQELALANRELAQLAAEDSLTGIGNRRSFEQALARAWAEARRRQEPLALVMADVDHFKTYNDSLGHPAGDACLRELVAVLEGGLQRPRDRLFRYGGEEFVLVLVDTDAAGALHCAERLRAALAQRQLPHPLGHVTVSLGVAALVPPRHAGPDAAMQLLNAADAALYRAKQLGRDRVVLA